MKVSIKRVKVRTDWKWRTQWFPAGGQRVRHFHNTKGEAEAEKTDVEGKTEQNGTAWVGWPAEKRASVISLVGEADERGINLREALDFFIRHRDLATMDLVSLKALVHESNLAGVSLRGAFEFFLQNQSVATNTMRVGQAYSLWVGELKIRRISKSTMSGYTSNVGRFVTERATAPLVSITRDEVSAWLANPEWSPNTYNSYLTSLNTFFKWCADTGKIVKAPTATLKKIKRSAMPNHDQSPVILDADKAKRLLRATMTRDPGLLPYVVTGLFGGLRPESEAEKLPACDVNGQILVRGTHAKDRKRRYVEIHPTLKAWLDLGGDFATVDGDKIKPVKNLRKRFELIREAAGLIRIEREGLGRQQTKKIVNTGWADDCLRHSFASHYLPAFGAEKTTAQLGHADYAMLFQHYRALVTNDDAAAYWSLTPGVVKAGAGSGHGQP